MPDFKEIVKVVRWAFSFLLRRRAFVFRFLACFDVTCVCDLRLEFESRGHTELCCRDFSCHLSCLPSSFEHNFVDNIGRLKKLLNKETEMAEDGGSHHVIR